MHVRQEKVEGEHADTTLSGLRKQNKAFLEAFYV